MGNLNFRLFSVKQLCRQILLIHRLYLLLCSALHGNRRGGISRLPNPLFAQRRKCRIQHVHVVVPIIAVMQRHSDTLRAFHDALYEAYAQAFDSRRNAMLRMKELWFYLIHRFEGAERYGKQLRKASDPRDFEAAVERIFTELPLRPETVPGW